MSERFKEPVLKTGDGATHRGFESHSLRQNTPHPIRGAEYFNIEVGFKEGGLAVGKAKNMPVACFLGRGRIHRPLGAPGRGVNSGRSISRSGHPNGWPLFG